MRDRQFANHLGEYYKNAAKSIGRVDSMIVVAPLSTQSGARSWPGGPDAELQICAAPMTAIAFGSMLTSVHRSSVTAQALLDLIAAWASLTGAFEVGAAVDLRNLIEREMMGVR